MKDKGKGCKLKTEQREIIRKGLDMWDVYNSSAADGGRESLTLTLALNRKRKKKRADG